MKQIRIIHAGIGEAIVQGQRVKVVRGTLPPEYVSEDAEAVFIPEYQRVAMVRGAKHTDLKAALAPDGIGVPDDLLLCSRSERIRPVGAGEVIIETEGLDVIDGHQRIAAARARLMQGQKIQPLGVKILLGTEVSTERGSFYQLNRKHTEVSTDVHLRNSGTTPLIEELWKLAATDGFPVVRWDQERVPGEDIRAHMLYEVTIMLHGHAAGKEFEEILEALEAVAKKHGTALVTQNVAAYFTVLRQIFGRRANQAGEANGLWNYMYRIDLMRGLAKLFSRYEIFWDKKNPNKLAVSTKDINKLRGVKLRFVERDLGSSGATNALFDLLYKQVRALRDSPLEERSWKND